jgi:hypothetical protein
MSWSVNAVDCASTGPETAGSMWRARLPRNPRGASATGGQPTAQVDEESAVDVLVHEAAQHRVEQGDLVSAVAAHAAEKEIDDPAKAMPRHDSVAWGSVVSRSACAARVMTVHLGGALVNGGLTRAIRSVAD